MRRRLDSRWTWSVKVLNPVVWTLSLASIMVGILSLPPDPTDVPAPFWGMFAVAMVVGAVAVGWLAWSLKWVEMDETRLYVRGLRDEAVVPLVEIDRVTQNRWLNTRHVRVSFRRDTDAGTRVVFLPARTRWAFWREDEVVEALRLAATRARKNV